MKAFLKNSISKPLYEVEKNYLTTINRLYLFVKKVKMKSFTDEVIYGRLDKGFKPAVIIGL